MLRRFYLFGIGIILGVFMLSFGPENRLKKHFILTLTILILVRDNLSFRKC